MFPFQSKTLKLTWGSDLSSLFSLSHRGALTPRGSPEPQEPVCAFLETTLREKGEPVLWTGQDFMIWLGD